MRRHAADVVPLWFFSAVGAIAAVALHVLLGRKMGAEPFGQFVSLLAVSQALGPLAGFGASGAMVAISRGGTADTRDVRRATRAYVRRSSAAAAAAFTLWQGVSGTWPASFEWLLMLPFVLSYGAIESVNGSLQLRGNYRALAYWQAFPHVLRLALFAIGFSLGLKSPHHTALAIYGVSGVVVIAAQYRLGDRDPRGISSFDWRGVALRAWPFGAAAALYIITLQVGVVVLGELGLDADAAAMSVVVTGIVGVQLLPLVIVQRYLLPRLFRLRDADSERLANQVRRWTGFSALLGVVAALGVAGVGPAAVNALYGESFSAYGSAVMLSALCLPLRFASTAGSAILLDRSEMRFKVQVMMVAAAAHAIGCVILCPRLGVLGGVISLVASDALFLTALLRSPSWSAHRPAAG